VGGAEEYELYICGVVLIILLFVSFFFLLTASGSSVLGYGIELPHQLFMKCIFIFFPIIDIFNKAIIVIIHNNTTIDDILIVSNFYCRL